MRHFTKSIFSIKLLRQFESVFKTALAHLSGDPGVPLKEKSEGQKSGETVPLKIAKKSKLENKFIYLLIKNIIVKPNIRPDIR
jgi:hypothetical protein